MPFGFSLSLINHIILPDFHVFLKGGESFSLLFLKNDAKLINVGRERPFKANQISHYESNYKLHQRRF